MGVARQAAQKRFVPKKPSGHVLLALLEFEDGAGLLSGLGVDKEAASSSVAASVAAAGPAPGARS
ncbi:Clp protease N-terminal domain-containing protein [[Kitasatospora] papulosa]|uniref:Clp protease N-terminal domain-containing protein n=1 Tax=[Kitasatospora] papulosa TaxID=1464011 RepID=UPI00367D4B75